MSISSASRILLASAAALAMGLSWAAPTPLALITDGSLEVDSNDIAAYVLRIPEERRGDFFQSFDRVMNTSDNIFVTRSLAAKARAEGLGGDPVTRRKLQQAEDQVLADAYARKLASDIAKMDLERRAQEIYKADPKSHTIEEQVAVQHIIVDMRGRTREMARSRANEAYAKAKAGEDFTALVQAYSDDPEKAKNKGDLGYAMPSRFTPQLREAVAKLKDKEVTPPIETEYGYHIVRLTGRKPAQELSFEAVKKDIVTAEKERLHKERLAEAVREIHASPTAVVHRENLEKLVIPIDPSVIRRANEAQKAMEAQVAGEATKAK